MSTPPEERPNDAESKAAEPASSPERRGISRLLGWVHNLFGTAILCGFGYYVWTHRSEFSSMFEISAASLALLVAISLASLVFNAFQMWVLLRASKLTMSFGEGFALSCAAGLGNYMPMRTGTLIRAHYLKSVHGLRYARFASVTGIRTIITIFATGALGLCGTLAVAATGGHLSLVLLLGFLAMLLVPIVAWVVRVPGHREGAGRIERIARDFLEGAKLLREQPSASLWVLLAVVLQELSLVARFYVATTASGGDAPFALIFLLSPVAAFASYAALTPGALGLREAAMGGATFAVGASFSRGILLGTLDRAVFMAVTAVVGGFSFLYIWLKIRSAGRAQPHVAAP